MTARSSSRFLVVIALFAALAACNETTPPDDFRLPQPTLLGGNKAFVSLALGDFHSCGLLESGEAFCWGLNSQGQSGNGVTGSVGVTTPVPVEGGFRFGSLTAGGSHTCGILNTGLTSCWGNNEGGQLGTGDDLIKIEPTPVVGGHVFTQISGGSLAHTCAIKANGEAWCWGFNSFGNLGDGTQTPRTAPAQVSGGLVFTSIASGGGHTCGLTANGTAYCWGLNSRGQLGDGTTTNRNVPVIVSTTLKFKQLGLGVAHTCALAENGDPYCWGDNVVGALGDGTVTTKLTPNPVEGGHNFDMLAVGERHACGIGADGVLVCWGYNAEGSLGDGTTLDRLEPVVPQTPLRFKKIAAGAYHTCAISTTNATYCWGNNSGFQSGSGAP